ncbi:MAG: hypothetical protein WCS65_15735 [Verrucomicrobiae bacterium]
MKQYLISALAKALGVSKSILEFFLPIFRVAAVNGMDRLLPIALGIVTDLALNNNLSKPDKRIEALKQLQSEALRTGIICGVSVLNASVENAVLLMKENDPTK